MADVRVYDQDYVQALEASVIVGGSVNEAGQLVLERGNGEEFNAGNVVSPLYAFPVGSIYTSVVNTNPTELFGGGTWSRFGQGRVLVGVNESDVQFDTVLETGGAKTHTLTESEMPNHNHEPMPDANLGSLNISANTINMNIPASDGLGTMNVVTTSGGSMSEVITTVALGSHNHEMVADGGGSAHNNLQPYVTVYMWRRTA